MAIRTEPAAALQGWLAIPGRIEKALDGLAEADLDLRGGEAQWSIRETVHHLVEANLVASNIIIAGLGKSGCIYDWSWLWPNTAWNQRLGYGTAAVRPALDTLRALCEHIAGLIRTHSDGFQREVQLLDSPGAKLYTRTITDILLQEIKHVDEHLPSVAEIRAAHAR